MDHQQEISPRQAEILKLVVEGYIQHSTPISSLFLTENYQIGLSSASIRSIFVDLEGKGYLYSPHRSSGRIPTEKGYRHYVAHLPPARVLLEEDQRVIQSEYLKRDFRINEVLDVSSRILAMLTNYAAVVIAPEPEKAALKHIELIDMGGDEVLVILVTRSGAVFSRTVFLESRIPPDTIRAISRSLNERFKGMDLAEVRLQLKHDAQQPPAPGVFLPMIARTIAEHFDSVKGAEEVYTAGIESLFNRLAQEESGRARDLGALFESPDFVRGIFKRTIDLDDMDVLIEGDHDQRLQGLSIVSASYKMGERRIGALGVVGPNRMDYVRVLSIVEYLRRIMSNMITRLSN
ncbi:MAG: heat-inducible transcriptional repressor HrcA [Leptospirales bacterium]|nr:heat-inducible transcriptional repressor HrcA [Leptospirales bacterium]